jgi:hypothetical protein
MLGFEFDTTAIDHRIQLTVNLVPGQHNLPRRARTASPLAAYERLVFSLAGCWTSKVSRRADLLSMIAAVGWGSRPSLPNQSLNDAVPSAGISPGIKITLDRRVWREFPSQARHRQPVERTRK